MWKTQLRQLLCFPVYSFRCLICKCCLVWEALNGWLVHWTAAAVCRTPEGITDLPTPPLDRHLCGQGQTATNCPTTSHCLPIPAKALLAPSPWLCCLKTPTCHPPVSSWMPLAPSWSDRQLWAWCILPWLVLQWKTNLLSAFLVIGSAFVIFQSWSLQELIKCSTFQNLPSLEACGEL